jgi:hypothetical protein
MSIQNHYRHLRQDSHAPARLDGIATTRALLSALPEKSSVADGLNCKHAVGKPSCAFRIVMSGYSRSTCVNTGYTDDVITYRKCVRVQNTNTEVCGSECQQLPVPAGSYG